jgi:hypothetical protein
MDQPDVVAVKDPGFLIGKPRYRLRREWVMRVRGVPFVIPDGYEFDGASVPRFLWAVTGYTPYGRHIAAALEHDRLCELRGDLGAFRMTSREVHDHFYVRLLKWGVRPSKAKLMGWAVRWFGPRWDMD